MRFGKINFRSCHQLWKYFQTKVSRFLKLNSCIQAAMLPSVERFMYRLYHEVEVSTWFTHRGPEARGCVNHVGTDTEWYNRLVPWATWPWQRIYGLATIASAIKGSSAYLATVQTVQIESDARYRADVPFSSDSSFFLDIQNHNTIVAVYKRMAAVWPVSISTRRRQLQLLIFKLLTRQSIAPPIQLTR